MTVALMFFEILKIWAIKLALIVFVTVLITTLFFIIFSLFVKRDEHFDEEFLESKGECSNERDFIR